MRFVHIHQNKKSHCFSYQIPLFFSVLNRFLCPSPSLDFFFRLLYNASNYNVIQQDVSVFCLKRLLYSWPKGNCYSKLDVPFSNDSASVKADILFRLLPTHLNRLEENPMRRETKALLQENNQQESLLSPDFQSALTNMMTYLRATRLPYSLQEQARRQITQLFLTAQKQGLSPDEALSLIHI